MDLYALRHGKAEEPGRRGDAARRLTQEGAREMAKIAGALHRLGYRPGRIASSPLKRARQTAEAVVAAMPQPGRPTIEIWDELIPEADIRDTLARLSESEPDGSVMVVGHQPHLGALVGEAVSAGAPAQAVLKKGALAHVRVSSFSHKPHGHLRALIPPRALRAYAR